MKEKFSKLLMAIILAGVLIIPVSLVGAENEDVPLQEESDKLNGNIVSNSDLLEIERVSDPGIDLDRSNINWMDQDRTPARYSPRTDLDTISDQFSIPEGVRKLKNPPMVNSEKTRATDDEGEQSYPDFANGSVIDPNGETVSGNLAHSNNPADVDPIDWYKLGLSDVATTAGGSPVYNISVTLDEYYASEGTLYEYGEDDTGSQVTLKEDWGDFLEVYVIYTDEWFGQGNLGGWTWFYDDGDDTDGWYHDDNWTLHTWSPRHSWQGPDNDGFANGYREWGWMYIGISWNYYATADSPTTRPAFTAEYEFTVDTSTTVTRDAVGNYKKNATTFSNIGSRVTDNKMWSIYNSMDWWEVSGSDTAKLWNYTIEINRTSSIWYGQPTATDVWDNRLYIWVLTPHYGEDGIWDTEDDGFSGANRAMSYIYEGGGFIGDEFRMHLHNNWTDAPDRTVWIGLMEQPMHGAIQNGQIAGWYYFPDHYMYSTYDLKVSIGEIEPNIAPSITNVEIKSDFEQDPSGGYYDTEFEIFVEYTDENNDPPEVINVIIDKDTPYEKIVDISDSEVDVFDNDLTDGKRYKLVQLGEDLTDTPYPHTVHVNCTDSIPERAIRGAKDSLMFEYEEGLRVWDDEPVIKNQNWQGMPELQEDDDETYVPLEGFDGMFKDPENNFRGFRIWDPSTEEWVTDLDVFQNEDDEDALLHINITEHEGIWQAVLSPYENQHGSAPVRFMGYDDHSSVNLSSTIVIREVNDPPMVTAVRIDGTEYTVDNAQPLRPVIHLEDEPIDVLEDQEFEFQIIAEDTDLEEDWTDLEYSYLRPPQSDDWDDDPKVEYNTGIVTFTPTNSDVWAGNSKMVFEIDDHRENGDIKLEVYFDVQNVNDDPTIMIPSTTARTWKQFSKVSIRPIASDEDKNDQITFSVNFEEAIGDEHDPILDQLPYADVTKGIDWDINPTTGDFFFQLDDQNIWKTSTGMQDTVEIVLVFKAEDQAGGEATTSINLILTDENEPPEEPDVIHANPTKPETMEVVNFYVDPLSDPDGDKLTYRWDFGDGSSGEGINVNHTYTSKGWKTVQMWAEDGQFQTEKISLRIEVLEPEVTGDDDDDDDVDDDDVQSPQGDDNMVLIIAIVVIVVIVLLIIIIAMILILRKKPAPAAQQYPGYDQQQLGAYGAQGLPPGQTGELPPQEETPELPPSQEGGDLPPAGGEQPGAAPEAPGAQPMAPAAQPETEQPQEEAPSGNACPSCGAAVDPTWFLCPNCKSPLQ